VHVYLTVPYVLSWSILEAMATGCLLIASDTAPVREVAKNGVEAILVDFHSPEGLAGRILECLQWGDGGAALRQRARARIARDYSVRRLLPRHIDLIRGLDGAESRLPQSREQRAERGQEGPDHR
jgi:glycosyltransferase involved in cell wall biosynthesis